jgi:hypothetical protein
MHAGDIEIAIARYLDPRMNLIVPNVSWGLGYYEKDLFLLTPAGYAWEIEIKVSKSDLIADKKKLHGHYNEKVKRLYFAVPETLEKDALSLIPERAGLFIVIEGYSQNYVRLVRTPKININAMKLTEAEIKKLHELAAMRIWSLKEVVYKLQREARKSYSNARR